MILTKLIFIFTFIKLLEKLEKRSISAILIQNIFDYRKYRFSKSIDPYKGKESFLARKYQYLMPNPAKYMNCSVKENFIDGMQIYTMNDLEKKDQKTFIYFYGSAYYRQITILHLRTLKKIIRDTNVKVILPNYNKAYDHNFTEVYGKILAMYKDIIKNNPGSEIYMGGDSSGGGIALGFSKYLRDLKCQQPKDLFLFSPWLDLSFSNQQYKKYEKYEAYLDVKRLKDAGEFWAGAEGNIKHPYASPVYGDLKNLPTMHIFTGTHDIFYPDIRKFHKRLKEEGIPHKYISVKNMVHAYNVFPIREAKPVHEHVCSILK